MKHLAVPVLVLLGVSLAAGAGAAPQPPHDDARVVYLQSKRTRTLERLVRVLLSDGKTPEARRLLDGDVKRISALPPEEPLSTDDARLLYLAGVVEELAGAPVRRDELFGTVRRRTPDEEFTHLLLGKTFAGLHRRDIAEAELRKVLALGPEGSVQDAEALERLAHAAWVNREYTGSADFFARLLKLLRTTRLLEVPEQMLAGCEYMSLVSRGHALLEEGRPETWQTGLELCERAWRLSPLRIDAPVLGERLAARCPEAARREELAKTWRDRSERLAESLRRAVRASPRDAHNHNGLAWLFAELGRNHDEGIRAVKRALELRPAEPAFIDTLAELQFKKGDVRAAVATIRRVTDLYPFANDYYRRQLERFEAALQKPESPGAP